MQVVSKKWLHEHLDEDITEYGADDSRGEVTSGSDDERSESEHPYSQLIRALRQTMSPSVEKMEVNTVHGRNYAKQNGLGEYEVHYSSGNDSDSDIIDWMSTSDEWTTDCMIMDREMDSGETQ